VSLFSFAQNDPFLFPFSLPRKVPEVEASALPLFPKLPASSVGVLAEAEKEAYPGRPERHPIEVPFGTPDFEAAPLCLQGR